MKNTILDLSVNGAVSALLNHPRPPEDPDQLGQQKSSQATEDSSIFRNLLFTPLPEALQLGGSDKTKTPQEYFNEFTQIVNSREKLLGILKSTYVDVLSIRTPSMFLFEKETLWLIFHRVSEFDPEKILENYPHLFNMNRTLAKMNNFIARMRQRGIDAPLEDFHKKLKTRLTGELAEFPGDPSPLLNMPSSGEVDMNKSGPQLSNVVELYRYAQKRCGTNCLGYFYCMHGPRSFSSVNISVGRKYPTFTPTIDLPPPYYRGVSRLHLRISLRNDGFFYGKVHGHSIILNGVLLTQGQEFRLNHADVIDMGKGLVVFFENYQVMAGIRMNPNSIA